jgi:hypothetical protein
METSVPFGHIAQRLNSTGTPHLRLTVLRYTPNQCVKVSVSPGGSSLRTLSSAARNRGSSWGRA